MYASAPDHRKTFWLQLRIKQKTLENVGFQPRVFNKRWTNAGIRPRASKTPKEHAGFRPRTAVPASTKPQSVNQSIVQTIDLWIQPNNLGKLLAEATHTHTHARLTKAYQFSRSNHRFVAEPRGVRAHSHNSTALSDFLNTCV